MATAATIKKNIAKLEAALKSKATPKTLKPKLEAQLVKSKAELSGIKKGTKPKTSSTKSTQTALQKLKEMVNKNKKLKTYKKSGVDLEKDADRPALPIGRRTAKQSGKTYYEYRANRIDVKQPPKRYPKLEDGGKLEGYKDLSKVNPSKIEVVETTAYGNPDKLILKFDGNKIAQFYYNTRGYNRDFVLKNSEGESYIFANEKPKGAQVTEFKKALKQGYTFLKYYDEMEKGGYMADGGETAKFQVDDVVYHKDFNTIGIVRIGEQLGTVKTDADGNVDVDELEYYNPLKHEAHKNAQIAPSTRKEIEERMLWKPFGERTSKLAKGGYYAKGGLTEHGLKVGDTIVDDMFWDKSVKVLNSKTGYAVVKIETGERKEMKAMGGEMHRTQE